MLQSLFDLRAQNTLPDFKSVYLKQTNQQDQDKCEFFVGSKVLDILHQQSDAKGVYEILYHFSLLWRALTDRLLAHTERITLAWQTLCFVVYAKAHIVEHEQYTTNSQHPTPNTLSNETYESTLQLVTGFIFAMSVMVIILLCCI